jgi:hypothetical protein
MHLRHMIEKLLHMYLRYQNTKIKEIFTRGKNQYKRDENRIHVSKFYFILFFKKKNFCNYLGLSIFLVIVASNLTNDHFSFKRY